MARYALQRDKGLLTRLTSAAHDADHARLRTLAALRLNGDLRTNVSARPAAALARRHVKELRGAGLELRRLHHLASTLTAAVAITAWETSAQRSLQHAEGLIQQTDDIVWAVARQRPQ